MNAELIRKAREHAPFKPFTLFLSDLRRFEIRHPDFLWLVPGTRVAGVADGHGAMELIDLVHITSLKIEGLEDSAE